MELADLDLNKSYTYADYLKWNFKERVELIKGRLLPMNPMTYTVHQQVSGYLSAKLYNYLKGNQGSTYTRLDVRFPINNETKNEDIVTVVQPDIIVVCDESKFDEMGCVGVPHIVIEILSAGSNITELRHKFGLYEESGVKEYWVVSPQNNYLTINTLVNGKYISSRAMVGGDVVTTSILPGYSLNVEELFSRCNNFIE